MIRRLRPNSLSLIVSVAFGLLLLILMLVTFIRFAKGNVLVALFMAILSTLMLSLFLGWVDVVEESQRREQEAERPGERTRSRSRRLG